VKVQGGSTVQDLWFGPRACANVRDGDISFMWIDSEFRASNQEGLAGLNNGGGH
jgi:hypothetical protein